MKLFLLLSVLLIGTLVHGQSLTEPIPKPAGASTPVRPRALLGDTLTPGVNFKGLRLQGAGALYGIALKPLSVSTSSVAVVYGIGWENDTWDAAKGRFFQKIGISLLGGPGGTVGSGLVGIIALTISTQLIFNLELPFKVVLGVAYNTAVNKIMAVTGPINGLNN